MARRLKAALHNFLSHFSSRYSDYRGYWLFGMLLHALQQPRRIDLLEEALPEGDAVLRAAAVLAKRAFRTRMTNARIDWSRVSRATLEITKMSDTPTVTALVNGYVAPAYEVALLVTVRLDDGSVGERSLRIRVAAHDPLRELMSARASS